MALPDATRGYAADVLIVISFTPLPENAFEGDQRQRKKSSRYDWTDIALETIPCRSTPDVARTVKGQVSTIHPMHTDALEAFNLVLRPASHIGIHAASGSRGLCDPRGLSVKNSSAPSTVREGFGLLDSFLLPQLAHHENRYAGSGNNHTDDSCRGRGTLARPPCRQARSEQVQGCLFVVMDGPNAFDVGALSPAAAVASLH